MRKCIRLGKGNARLKIEPKSLCLSDRQQAVLQPEAAIACGSTACAYTRPDGRVVKFTQDRADVAALERLQGDPRVVRLDASYRLTGSPYYAVVVERLHPAPRWARTAVNRIHTPATSRDAYKTTPMSRFSASGPNGHLDPERLAKETCAGFGHGGKRCRRLIKALGTFYVDARARGILVRDIHGDNIGVDADGHPKLLDLGMNSTAVPPRAAALAGFARRRRRRKRN